MINKTIEKIEASIQKMNAVDPKKKKEIIHLLSALKFEVKELSKTHREQAQSIESHLGTLSQEGLSASVQGFEASHPRLVQTVNDFCNLLANIGI